MAQPPTAGRARSRASYGRPRVILVAGEALYDLNDTATTEIYTLSLTTSSDLGGRRIIAGAGCCVLLQRSARDERRSDGGTRRQLLFQRRGRHHRSDLGPRS